MKKLLKGKDKHNLKDKGSIIITLSNDTNLGIIKQELKKPD